MAEIIIAKTKLRRGTDAQRQLVVFDQGEPVFTTDTKRLFVGVGTTTGGTVIGSKVHPPLVLYSSLSNTNAQVGDLVYANNKFYQLTAQPFSNIDSWHDVGLKANPSVFSYDSSNNLQLNLSGLSAIQLDPNTIGFGLTIVDNVLQLNVDTNFFSFSSNALTLNNDSISEYQILASTLSSGLVGGSGEKIRLEIDTKYFEISSNALTLRLSSIDEFIINPSTLGLGLTGGGNAKIQVDIDTTHLGFSGNKLAVDVAGMVGPGLTYDTNTNTISATLTDVDNINIISNGGVVTLTDLNTVPLAAPLVAVSVDTYGRVSDLQTSMYDLIEIDTNGLPENVFNGSANVSFNPLVDIVNTLTVFTGTTVSNGLSVVSLSSAGMIALEGGFSVRGLSGVVMKRFAIPVFVF